MSSKSRPKNTSVVDRLVNAPYAYSMTQAMRLLERATSLGKPPADGQFRIQHHAPVAEFTPPSRESVRLVGDHLLAHPGSEVGSIRRSDGQWILRVRHIGLTGAMGVLPYHYTELILQRIKKKDFSLRDFMDLFNHRTASLFYQASVKYHLPLEYERKKLSSSSNGRGDSHTLTLLALMGLGTRHLDDSTSLNIESLVFYSGLFNMQVRSASGLKQIIEHYFAVPVVIQEFVGQWQDLIPEIRCRLGSRSQPKGQNASLGLNAVLGSRGWFSQGKIKIVLGPLDYQQFNRFAPGTSTLKALNELVRLYVGLEQDYSFAIQVQREDFPRQISFSQERKPMMGWNIWLGNRSRSAPKEDKHMTIEVSANRLK